MQKYSCYKCNGVFTSNDKNWVHANCPHCGIKVSNPDKMESMGNEAAMIIVKLILAAILIGVVFSTM